MASQEPSSSFMGKRKKEDEKKTVESEIADLFQTLGEKLSSLNDCEISKSLEQVSLQLKNNFFSWLELEHISENRRMDEKGEEIPLTKAWFQDASTKDNFNIKEDYLIKIIEHRLSSYITRFLSELDQALNNRSAEKYKILKDELHEGLEKGSKATASAFIDRRQPKAQRVCDERGGIKCQGEFEGRNTANVSSCKYEHHWTNPYGSAKSLCFFGHSFNLDHTFTIIDVAKVTSTFLREGKEIDSRKVLELLISPKNLKFVHVKCHSTAARTYKNVDGTPLLLENLIMKGR